MAETEVESILREIREQVLAQQSTASATAVAKAANGNSEFDAMAPASTPLIEDNLALFNSYLTTTARTWDRLPPVVSNRSGAAARLELWVKRLLKRATRWFTWEQVNFNASVHHALGDLPALLSAVDREMARLRQQLKCLEESQFVTTQQFQSDLQTERGELEMQRRTIEAQGARLAELVSEFRERVMHLQEEQRVSLKQLALETSEAATLEDRARRKTETMLQELQRRIEQLEAKSGK
jgi:uncharacterized membrane-anchored protein YhcB (DUF1043 family)